MFVIFFYTFYKYLSYKVTRCNLNMNEIIAPLIIEFFIYFWIGIFPLEVLFAWMTAFLACQTQQKSGKPKAKNGQMKLLTHKHGWEKSVCFLCVSVLGFFFLLLSIFSFGNCLGQPGWGCVLSTGIIYVIMSQKKS